MPIGGSSPQDLPGNPYLPPGPPPLVFEQFEGMNTSSDRAGVPDEQCYWIDGLFPIAPRELRTLWGSGTAIYTAAGKTVVFFDFANIGSTPYCIAVQSDGSVIAINTNSLVVTTILSASTITSPTIVNVGITQWGSQYIIIVAGQTNGYWLWDGNAVYTAGTIGPIITMTNNGSGYSGGVTVNLSSGHGSGSSLTASVNAAGQIVSVSVVNPGTGYVQADSVSVVFSAPTGGTGGSINAFTSSVVGRGIWTLSSLTIIASGSGYGPNTSLVMVGGSLGVEGTAFPIIANGSITSTSITYGGQYRTSAAPTVTITDTPVTASATAQLMPFGIQGTAVETYQGHVWVANGPVIYFTAPGSMQDFSTSNGGGNFTSADSFLKVSYINLINVNGFLYLIGDSSINYISGVQTSGSPPTTTFTNLNADPEVGTPYPASAEVMGQNILFANSFGVHVIAGARAIRVSEALDGVFNTVANFGGLQLSASKAVIYDKKVWMVLAQIIDPVSGSTVNKIFIWDGAKKWFASGQDITLNYIKHQEINSVITAYGTNGTVISPLFSSASSGFTKTVQSKLFDEPGGLLGTKTPSRFWLLGNYTSTVSANLDISVDNENCYSTGVYVAPTGSARFTITGPTGKGYFVSNPQSVGQQGVLSGLTIKTSAADMKLIAAILKSEFVQYRG